MNRPPRAVRPFALLKKGSFPSQLNKRQFFTVMKFLDMSSGKTPRTPAQLLPIFEEAKRRYPAGNNISTLGLSTYAVGSSPCKNKKCTSQTNYCKCNFFVGCSNGYCEA